MVIYTKVLYSPQKNAILCSRLWIKQLEKCEMIYESGELLNDNVQLPPSPAFKVSIAQPGT